MMTSIINEQIEMVSEVAGYLWQKGWCERNGGNISIDLSGLWEYDAKELSGRQFVPRLAPEEAAGKILFITGTGERLRQLIHEPEKASCVILIDREARGYHILWGAAGNSSFRPTSEFISHLRVHIFNEKAGKGHRCVLHVHPNELIAISHHPVLGHSEEALNKAIWSMLPETRVFLPRGISLAPYALPGSEELAQLTISGLEHRDLVLWSKHGVVATGKDIREAFDFIDVANKGVSIYLKCLQAGFTPEGMSDNEMKALGLLFKI